MVSAFALFSTPRKESLLIGVPVSLAGLLLRGWAAGHLAKDRSLAATGPYAHVRNPLYLGTAMVAAGFAVASRQWTLAMLFAGIFLFIYLPAIELEEQHLRALFSEYGEYSAHVPPLLPAIGKANAGRFRLDLYVRNKEYQALLGFLAGLAFLVWKAAR